MQKIDFACLFDAIEPLYDEYMKKIGELIRDTAFIGGSEVEGFEQEFAAWTGCGFATGTANGTDSIIVALKALKIGAGDRVLVPVNTFIATAEAVTMTGAEVDFVDVEDDFYTMDPVSLEKRLASSTGKSIRAVIPVHLYGQMADMPAIMGIARKYGIKVIEDSAQAHGSSLDGKHPGFFGDIATWSFYPGKNLGAFGDAGAITTNDESLNKVCKMLVNHGRWKAKYEHEIEGMNMRLDSLQAAILRIKLRHLSEWTALRKEKAAEYLRLLDGVSGVRSPSVRSGADPVWHIFAVRLENRDATMQRLKELGISTGIHYPIPLHLQPAYAYKGYLRGAFPVAERQCREQLSLPLWPEIPKDSIAAVVSALASA